MTEAHEEEQEDEKDEKDEKDAEGHIGKLHREAEGESEDDRDEGEDKGEGRSMSDARLKRAVRTVEDTSALLARLDG